MDERRRHLSCWRGHEEEARLEGVQRVSREEGRAPLRYRFFIWMEKRTREPQLGEGGGKISLSRLIDEYARSHPRLPAPVQGAGGVPQDVRGTRRGTEGPRLHHDVVEDIQDKRRAGPERRPRRRRHNSG